MNHSSGPVSPEKPPPEESATPEEATAKRRILGFDLHYLKGEWKDMFNPATMMNDLWAGITVALVALPLNLALAIAAGVEPGIGITTGIIAGVIGSLFGGQRHAITGPAAAMAVVLIEIAHVYGLGAIWMVGLLAGMMQIAAGAFRLGKLISFIPMPVIVGFANAIGVLVLFNALDDFLGLPAKKMAHAAVEAKTIEAVSMLPEFLKDVHSLVQRVIIHHEFSLPAIGIGALVLVVAVIVPKLLRAVPGQLVAIVVASLVAHQMQLQIPKIIDISSIPNSLPFPQVPVLPWSEFGTLFASSITVFLLGSIESLLSASVADGMTMSRRHHSDQELIGQGLANVATPFFGGIPVTGVIARTAINIRSGAKTRLSGVVHSLVLLGLSIVFARFAEQIPLSALGAVLILTGFRLIERDATVQIWRASRTEGIVLLLTTTVSILADLTAGVVTGLLLTCGMFIRQMSAVKITSEDDDRRAHVRQPVPSCKYVRTFLIDGPLFFGAAERFTETILVTHNIKAVIIHLKAVDVMDLTGAETILSIHAQLARNDVRIILAEVPRQAFELLKRVKAVEKIGRENFFKKYEDALLSANQKLLETSCSSCAACLDDVKREGEPPGPKDCMLRSALILNTNQIASKMRARLAGQAPTEVHHFEADESDLSRLYPIVTPDDIPEVVRNTPIAALISSQNFFQAEPPSGEEADLIVGMCIDFRQQLHLPKNAAYVLRQVGANMRGLEFSVGLALSRGMKHMALIVDNKCIMANPAEARAQFVETLSREHGWYSFEAAQLFDRQASSRETYAAIDFALQESARIEELFRGLLVVPLFYNVDNDRLYLFREWIERQGSQERDLVKQGQ